MLHKASLLVFALALLLGAGLAAQDMGEPQYAGLDMDLSGVNIRMATIGGGTYEVMYESISVVEEATGATVEIVALLDGFDQADVLRAQHVTEVAVDV